MSRENIAALIYQKDAQGTTRLYDTTGAPYTGLVIETLPTGYLTARYEVKNGLKDGVEKAFYATDEVEHVAHYWQGFLHGEVLYYYPEGGLKEKSVFEYDICLEESQWDEMGKLTHHQVLELPRYQQVLLETYRREWGSNPLSVAIAPTETPG